MNKIIILPFHNRFFLRSFLLIASLLIGEMVIIEPVATLLTVTGIIVISFAILNPDKISYFILGSAAISINDILDIKFADFDILSLYKLALLMLTIPAILNYGIYRKLTGPILALALLLVTTQLYADKPIDLTTMAPVKAFIGLAIPFIFLIIRWPEKVAERHIRIVCLLPIISVLIGVVLQVTGVRPALVMIYTGAIRLQGANIAPHLAMLAFLGLYFAMMEMKRKAKGSGYYYVIAGVNFLILLTTGTRGPLLASGFLIAVYIFDQVRSFLRGKLVVLIPLVLFLCVLAVLLFTQMDNLKKRSVTSNGDEVVNTSGRLEAWAYFLDRAKDSPWFGKGLGAVTVANDGTLYRGFVVPHNEYIRFFYDGGYIGAGIMFMSLIIVFIRIYGRLPKESRVYYLTLLLAFLQYSFTDNTLSTIQFTLPFCWYLNSLINIHHGAK
jgi:teichuronic acid biosynthesis protein TuaE